MKVLVTGGSGFIGTNVIDYFAREFEVVNLDIVEPKDSEQLQYWRKVDILDAKALESAILEFYPDYIIHLAAKTDLDGKSLEEYSANINGVKNLLVAARHCKNLKKILITSSMLVCKAGYYPRDQRDYCPTTLYGKSKVETENIVWKNQPLCDWALLRPTSIWGPWFSVPYRNFFEIVKRKMYFHIGRKSCTKTYGYIENTVYQIKQILFTETKNLEHKVFYLGDQPATNIEEWANEIAGELGVRIPRINYWMLKCVALLGDMLGFVGISFPMTSFRLKNMTTDNIIDLKETYQIAPNPPVTRIDGIKSTLRWMEIQEMN